MLVVDHDIHICILDIIMDIIIKFRYYFYNVVMLLLWTFDIIIL